MSEAKYDVIEVSLFYGTWNIKKNSQQLFQNTVNNSHGHLKSLQNRMLKQSGLIGLSIP